MQNSSERKAQPSGHRRYTLAEADMLVSNEQAIKYLIYMPIAATMPIVRQRFGEPSEQIPVREGAVYWLYPQQGLALLLNEQDGEFLLQ
ncbi:MAG: hypothetical protein R3E89_10940 [Thiolinea sp.]